MNKKKPMVLVLAGPNGSGKSTFTSHFDTIGQYTNADEITRATGLDNIAAARKADEMRYQSIDKGEDFTFETVLSSEYKMRILKAAKQKGYFIKCIFILTKDPDINIERVKSRVEQGGHDVEKKKIKDRYYKSIQNLKELFQICDILHVYDNTDVPHRLIRKHKEENIIIYPNEHWDAESILKLIE